jgi:hypothetical protein
MGLISSRAVIDAAKQVDGTITKTTLGRTAAFGISRRLPPSASRK